MVEQPRRRASNGTSGRTMLRRSASFGVMALVLAGFANPAHAQLAARRGPTLTAPTIPAQGSGNVRSPAANDALARQAANRSRADQIRTMATEARAAIPRVVPNGLQGLVVAQGVTPANLAAGALQAVRDSTGRATWQGAELPIESTNGGALTVTIRQTDARAVLSWDRFDVGSNTTLQFDQTVAGVAQRDWIAVNRVVDPLASASQILGQIKADGTVVVINRNGLIFGSGAKVSANSLLASSLDIGNFVKFFQRPIANSNGLDTGRLGTTIQDRNIAFLQNGLVQPDVTGLSGMLTSSLDSQFYSNLVSFAPQFDPAIEGAVTVERGASITAGTGGFVILTGPEVSNGGTLTAVEGQVSLQAGRAIGVTPSTGAAGQANQDPFIRGLQLRTLFSGGPSLARNSGLIETKRGYASLGAALDGIVTNAGLIAATTSVSRNGTISLTAGTVNLLGSADPSQASGLVILADDNGETIPQGTSGLPDSFKQSQIRIGGIYLDPSSSTVNRLGVFGPAAITFGDNSLLLAPNANVQVGGVAGQTYALADFSGFPGAQAALTASRIAIGAGAILDVSGIKDFALNASRNSLLIDPLKRNELRDTPNYRESNTTGAFTLNGATVYVDPRISGVRDDGVTYVGSPLIEAGSAASQIGVTAAELMTRGGAISLNVMTLEQSGDLASTPRIAIDAGATIDFSGGWVRYLDGVVRSSRLLTTSGRLIDIGSANPNEVYVAVSDGFSEIQGNFGIDRNFSSSILSGERFEAGYDEGRDAGVLWLGGSSMTLDGTLWGNAFPGQRQLAAGRRPDRMPSLANDPRGLQSSIFQMPAGGLLNIGNFSASRTQALLSDVIIGRPASAPMGALVLDDAKINQAGLSGLTVATSASISLLSNAELKLVGGGTLNLIAGRTITLDGDVTIASGAISARTLTPVTVALNPVAIASTGSPFRSDDNVSTWSENAIEQHPFDIVVTGNLSTAGRWTNDLGSSTFSGPSFIDGGSIRLEVAPTVLLGVGGIPSSPLAAVDASGRLIIAPGALLDVSAGGYVGLDGTFDLSGRGGDIALINNTTYAGLRFTDRQIEVGSRANEPIGGNNQTVQFTPFTIGPNQVTPSLVPDVQHAIVSFDAASLRGFGFAGGGTFTLVAPDIAMGSQVAPDALGPRIGLDFLLRTGFGTLDLTAFKSRLVAGLFNNGRTGLSAFADTERFVIGAGETLDLTQTVLPSLLDPDRRSQLGALASGGDIYSVLSPGIPASPFDRIAAHLRLGGFTELEVAQGGTITGAARASISASKLYNAGTIRIAGGSITQTYGFARLGSVVPTIGVRDTALGGNGLSGVLGGGTSGQTSGFDENALIRADLFSDFARTDRLTNGELFSLPGADALLVFTGRVALNEGIHLAAGSITDLSGTAIYDPRGTLFANGTQQRSGLLISGGSITTSNLGVAQAADGYSSAIIPSNQLIGEAGATIRLDGASAVFDERTGPGSFGAVAQWSNGGRLTIGGGAQLAGVDISAWGGDDGDADPLSTRAAGGVLDWVAPTLVQSYNGTDRSGATLAASQIMAAGFDTLIARGRLNVSGNVDLALGRSLIVTTATSLGLSTAAQLVVTAQGGGLSQISAPYIRFASSADRVTEITGSTTGELIFSAQAIDLVGATLFDVARSGPGKVRLEASGDIRLIGTTGIRNTGTGEFEPGRTGALVSNGDLELAAAQVYGTTGTGDLQQRLEDLRAGRADSSDPFLVSSSNATGTVRITRNSAALPPAPLSAGSYVRVLGANIVQDGVLRAPLGLLEIGSNTVTTLGGAINAPATVSLRLGPDSLTSVTGLGRGALGNDPLRVPYGTTNDLIEYFFSPGISASLTTVPTGELRLAGQNIVIASDSAGEVRVDGRGGGDVFAFEFIPGTGGSRDVLDRFNFDDFSGNNDLQFPDGRQVYAILPKNEANVALFDPIYSADYSGGDGGDLYGLQAGRSVWLDAAPGIAAGEYLLLPAHYALLPGALRIVENREANVPFAGGATTLLDGSIIVGGRFGTAGTGQIESGRHAFTVQSQDVFSKYSQIETVSGAATVKRQALLRDLAVPRLPLDAARVVLAPRASLQVAGLFRTEAATGGQGAQFDISGTLLRIAAPGAQVEDASANYVLLTTDTLASFNAQSLLIGGVRTDNLDGTTMLDVAANQILVDSNVSLTAPELLLVVGGRNSQLVIADAPSGQPGAVLRASGTPSDTRTGDYVIQATASPNDFPGEFDRTGIGSALRLSSGPMRLVTRVGDAAVSNSLFPTRLDIGARASLLGGAITLESSRTFAIDKTATIGAATAGGQFDLALSADALRIGSFTFASEIEAQFAQARNLTLRTPEILNFAPGTYTYNNLIIDAAGIGLSEFGDVTINTDQLELGNSGRDRGGCVLGTSRICGGGNALTINSSEITFTDGVFRTWGFDTGLTGSGVTLSADRGMYVSGIGSFDTTNFDNQVEIDATPLNLITPFIVDRTAANIAAAGYIPPDYRFVSLGQLSVRAPVGAAPVTPSGNQAPGARISFASGDLFAGFPSDLVIDGAMIRATAGTVDLRSVGSIFLQGTARLDAGGFTKTFDDGLETVTVSAGAGAVNLVSTGFGTVIDTSSESMLVVDSGVGRAGTLTISNSAGEVALRSRLNPNLAANLQRSASLRLDAGSSAFALDQFVGSFGRLFQGEVTIRSGSGDLTLAADQQLNADSVSLTADGGRVLIAGRIDTSGDNVSALRLTDQAYKDARIDGGAIALFGRNGVSLAGSAELLATTTGYNLGDTRQARGGDITIGIGTATDAGALAAIEIAANARIDISAARTGYRRVAETVIGAGGIESTAYRLAPGDLGGTVAFRAPVLAGGVIGFANAGTIVGARDISIEGYRRYDLDQIADSGLYSGVTRNPFAENPPIVLDAGAVDPARANFLSDDAAGTIREFIRTFSVSASSDQSLDGYRLRPGVELVAARTIQTGSGWNLGAGRIVNADGSPGYADAVAAGLLVESPLGAYTSGPLAGQMRYEVVFGREAELFSRFVSLDYRVGGSVRGEAPVVTFRAQGDLDIRHSISDGFFAFHDLTNPDFINYQLGGGDRTYNPALRITCGSGTEISCGDSLAFDAGTASGPLLPLTDRITIQIGTAQRGSESSSFFVNAPYNPLANSAAPSGTGDGFGVGELFPLLADGSAVHSSGLRLVAGAATESVNPIQIDSTQTGSVRVRGETSYEIDATRGTARIAGRFQLLQPLPDNEVAYFGLDELLDLIASGTSSEFDADAYTQLNWGTGTTGAAAAARAAALDYQPFDQDARFFGTTANPTGVAARLGDVLAFLRDSGFAETYANGVSQGQSGYNAVTNLPTPIGTLRFNTAYVGTVVRTGDGRIDVAAAADIDLRRTFDSIRRINASGTSGAGGIGLQVGSNAIYTAGVRAGAAGLRGADVPTFGGYAQTYVPGPTAGTLLAPVLAEGGGDITMAAGRDIIGRRDVWGENYGLLGSDILGIVNDATGVANPILTARGLNAKTSVNIGQFGTFGGNSSYQMWRYGVTSFDNVHVAIAPNLFTSGIGALSGGDVTIRAGRDVLDLTIALNNSLVTSNAGGDKTLIALGSGNLDIAVGRDLLGGHFDIASGKATLAVAGDVTEAAAAVGSASLNDTRNLLRLRVSDATVDLTAGGTIAIGGMGTLYGAEGDNAVGRADFFSPIAGVRIRGSGLVDLAQNRIETSNAIGTGLSASYLPPSLEVTSLFDDIAIGGRASVVAPSLMLPSRYGQLSLLAGGNIASLSLAMSDAPATNFFGLPSTENLVYPVQRSDTLDTALRGNHDRRLTHIDDPEPIRIIAQGSLNGVALSAAKQARIYAGEDIINLNFQGQNLNTSDVTRIAAGRDIIGTIGVSNTGGVQGRSAVLGNNIVLGGPGTLYVEAGRNLGPFVTSATGTRRTEGGGIRTIGNEANPWLGPNGAAIYLLFGAGKGVEYGALQTTYLDPANLDQLDGDLFVQTTDVLGNAQPDRSKYVYAPILARWLQSNAPDRFAAVFGAAPPAGAALDAEAFGKYGSLYSEFASLDQFSRNRFLINELYFGELTAPSNPTGPSFNQFVRGYRAVQTLFPPSLGYTDNLATYTLDPATKNADHPLGVPVKNLVNGQPQVADRVETGNVDLRLSTVQTARGGDITILGPGGNFIAGSIVRTEAQADRRLTAHNVSRESASTQQALNTRDLLQGNFRPPLDNRGEFDSIPQGLEGILTLRGGTIRGFTDGSFVLNQSRLFTQRGGDISLWSSNGDLNAGQGPRSSSNFPPIVLRFSPNGSSEVDSAGSVSGAGIGAFRSSPSDPDSSIRLLAPVGTVDAGDAGVRASGSIFVAAARVANAEGFSAGGGISGVPALTTSTPAPAPAAAASALVANAFKASDALGDAAQRLSRIFVDVLGYFGGNSCAENEELDADGKCKPR